RVLAHDDQVHVDVAAARHDRLDGAHVRIQLELLAQRHVHRAVPPAHGRGERALEREPGAADRIERRLRQRRARLFHGAHPTVLLVPVELDFQRVEHRQGRLGNLGPDSVAGDEGRLTPHGSPGVRLLTARVSAVQGSSPSPRATVRNPTRPVRTSTITTVSSAVAIGRTGGPADGRGGGPTGRGATCPADRLYTSPAGTSMNRPPPAPTSAASVRISLRSGSGTISSRPPPRSRMDVPIWSGSGAIPGARRAARRRSSGSSHVTSGARSLSSEPITLSARASAARRSPTSTCQWSESSATTRVRGVMATCCAAMPAVGRGTVGAGSSTCRLPPQPA